MRDTDLAAELSRLSPSQYAARRRSADEAVTRATFAAGPGRRPSRPDADDAPDMPPHGVVLGDAPNDPPEVAAYQAHGVDAVVAARAAHRDWRAHFRLTAGTGRKAIALSRFLAAHPAVMAAVGTCEVHGFRGG
jgi:hypothetical protein